MWCVAIVDYTYIIVCARVCVCVVKNEQGKILVESMKSTGLCFVHGLRGTDGLYL